MALAASPLHASPSRAAFLNHVSFLFSLTPSSFHKHKCTAKDMYETCSLRRAPPPPKGPEVLVASPLTTTCITKISQIPQIVQCPSSPHSFSFLISPPHQLFTCRLKALIIEEDFRHGCHLLRVLLQLRLHLTQFNRGLLREQRTTQGRRER